MHSCEVVTAAAAGDWVAMRLPGFQYFGEFAIVDVATPASLGLAGQKALLMDVISVPSGAVNEAYWFNSSKV